uniref:4-hydroxyphenylpyruvate dioxygenase n=1 Tax=Paramoeba aestuarina TaxID=180227 RepID=A0A7S4L101_9EUKA|mmetsp:Transcript_29634/g.45795  ORF Transcript_29634/g.45795 Transcript_29634/m.45795 type:complete len:649 (+) Transcript_29634:51-1997(+)|eukprot:CAMPEP_0201523040 /NCGR_PEP_ID=MMETSP0161_2-20130828/18710_1 /ASSEMBLY_ACC=CAM_ASM_000251 /TAXON_ID=180227 /ORGANISM="Neoparamoeba aestuarina, Strain SoJaBio B1-5/56/2" /LENGTH=648 /DNA_ID=CAMNT_0047922033 /DNA_START=71 /DNA_END=2017 /DNA_ORIENTATION=-
MANQDSIHFVFDHVHFYCHSLRPLEEYNQLEKLFTSFDNKRGKKSSIEEGRKIFEELGGKRKEHSLVNQDVVEQLICGFGLRISGHRYGASTNTVLLTSRDPTGIKFLLSAPSSSPATDEGEDKPFYQSSKITEFVNYHAGKQGCAILSFRVASGECQQIAENYKKMHPTLLCSEGLLEYEEDGHTVRLLEVYAYYAKEDKKGDVGTRIRFIESSENRVGASILPGLVHVEPEYPTEVTEACYADHWVSNVFDRESFLQTLNDTLGFTPKVNFNAGVVGAGEAVIESTVTGNNPSVDLTLETVLKDQSQVYLPINNALSKVGHVHMFLEQLGQGVQHIASRVPSLVEAIANANHSREMTGYGFAFLRIPRSYYGTLSLSDLQKAGASEGLSKAVLERLVASQKANVVGVVDMEITKEDVLALDVGEFANELKEKGDAVSACVLKSRYIQLWRLLRDHVDEETYLEIVRNKILVDIQGNDILYQIFTSNILNEKSGDESPFLEFIERVCSQKCDKDGNAAQVRPGCGGFGIRNFLTLFLSIEVSKAMNDLEAAREEGDQKKERVAAKMIEEFTNQLNASNPILTMISDAMTEESDILDELSTCQDAAKREELQARLQVELKKKEEGQEKLKVTGAHYNNVMKNIRENGV